MIPHLTFFSKWQKGVGDAVKRKFPTSCHAICMKHLSESIVREFKNPQLVQLLWKAAYATTTSAFKEKMAELEEVSAEATRWLQQYPPSRWALIYFEGTRYGHLSSNIEEFNQWILETRELPVTQVIEQIHCKLIMEFEERRARCKSWFSILAPSADKHVIEAMNRASTYQVLRSDEVEFELYGLPCSHAVAALISSKNHVYAFTAKYFTVASYAAAYAEEIHPVPGKIEWKKDGESETIMDNEIMTVRRLLR
ncbi:hypothetical protein C2S52_020777 [Perilla frutescens var. hirtella]|nr:hypothetical protein C2S52_020777 [Perilla frutescens var. hirtella]KAH6805109.1 hypothetical protein C2S51_029940 [Perilla frutescens var. frutescens]